MTEPLGALVERWNRGDDAALQQLIDLLYEDLRTLAHGHLRRERDDHTLGTTALVHEAYVQLAERTGPVWQGRTQLLALMSRIMRHILVDYARRRHALKRGGHDLHVPLSDELAGRSGNTCELLALNDLLDRLAAFDARLARVVECRFFGGMSEAEIAEALSISTRTVERDWLRARAHLFAMLGEASASGTPAD